MHSPCFYCSLPVFVCMCVSVTVWVCSCGVTPFREEMETERETTGMREEMVLKKGKP